MQVALESISDDLRVPGVRFSGVSKSVNTSLKIVTKSPKDILKDVAPQNADKAAVLLAQLQAVRAALLPPAPAPGFARLITECGGQGGQPSVRSAPPAWWRCRRARVWRAP